VANFQVFAQQGNPRNPPRLTASFQDGTSNTVAVSEAYMRCQGYGRLWAHGDWTDMVWLAAFATPHTADQAKQGNTAATKFQIVPTAEQCNIRLAQSPHAGAIQAGMADGSVRAVTASISADTWWHALTPASQDLLGSDW